MSAQFVKRHPGPETFVILGSGSFVERQKRSTSAAMDQETLTFPLPESDPL
jgi:hypothetical protein